MKTELGMTVRSTAPSKRRLAFVETIVELLAKEKEWVLKRDVAAKLGVPFTPSFDRRLRHAAEDGAPRIVSWPGSPGLRHWNFATVEDINHAIEGHRSQGNDHYRRANVYLRAYHSRLRVPVVSDGEQGALL